MEFLRSFIKEGYLKAIGKEEDYKIILGAGNFFNKGILLEEDLKEINEKIQEQYKVEIPDENTVAEELESNSNEIVENSEFIVNDVVENIETTINE